MLTLITHDGKFNPINVASTAFLRIIAETYGYGNTITRRVDPRQIQEWENNNMLLDDYTLFFDKENKTTSSCFVYDIENSDGHKILGHSYIDKIDEDGLPKSSFRMLWDRYGEVFTGKHYAKVFERSIVDPLDVSSANYNLHNEYLDPLSFIISSFITQPCAMNESIDNINESFDQAVQTVYCWFNRKFDELSLANAVYNSEIYFAKEALVDGHEYVRVQYGSRWARPISEVPEIKMVVEPIALGRVMVKSVNNWRFPEYVFKRDFINNDISEDDARLIYVPYNNHSITIYTDDARVIDRILCVIAKDMRSGNH